MKNVSLLALMSAMYAAGYTGDAKAQVASTCGATGTPLTGYCTSTGNPYAGGIALGGVGAPVVSAVLNIGTGVSVAPTTAGRRGITIVSNGTATINALSGVTVNTTGPDAIGIFTRTTANGDSTINVTDGNVSTNGLRANGVWADATGGGNASVTYTGSVTTNGNQSIGIEASTAGTGNATVTVTGAVKTLGISSHAIEALAQGTGNVMLTYNGGDVSTSGDSATGLLSRAASGNAKLAVALGASITTSGANAIGVYATSTTGSGNADIGATGISVTTNGASSSGILAQAGGTGSATVDVSGQISTFGTSGTANGVQAFATGSGDANMTFSGVVSTASATSIGISARAGDGTLSSGGGTATLTTLAGTDVSTAGANSIGVYAYAQNGDATLNASDITVKTSGAGSIGIEAQAGGSGNAEAIVSGNVTITGVATSSTVEHGIVASADGTGDATLIYSTGTVSTGGAVSSGLVARSGSGNVSLSAAADTHIITVGAGSNGIFAVTQLLGSTAAGGASVRVQSDGDIVTNGVAANGILARSHLDAPVEVVSNGDITTNGAGSTAIYASSEGGSLLATPQNMAGGDVTVTNTAKITTTGSGASGLVARVVNNQAAAGGTAPGTAEVRSSGDIVLSGGGSGAMGIQAANLVSDISLTGGQARVLATGNITTSAGTANHGIDATAQGVGGDASVTYGSGTITVAGTSDGIRVTDRDVGFGGTGTIELSSGGIVDASHGRFGLLAGEAGANSVTVADGSSVMGGWNRSIGAAGIGFVSTGRTPQDTLWNSGTVGAMTDVAIFGDGGAGSTLSMTNTASGTITGVMTLGTGTNSLTNQGVWNLRNYADSTGSGNRDSWGLAIANFGLGSANSISNAGLLNLVAQGTSSITNFTAAGAYLPLGYAANAPVQGGAVQGQILGVSSFSNSGVIDLTGGSGAVGNVLVISGGRQAGSDGSGVFVADGGSIRFNTVLNEGDANSQSDVLVLDSTRMGTGADPLVVRSVGANGALTTGNGILLVEVLNKTASADGVFMLGSRVAAGAYEYQLFHNGVGADTADGNWYLRNMADPTPDSPSDSVPIIRPEVPVDTVVTSLALGYGYAMLDTLHERVGETHLAPFAPATEDRVVWCKDPATNFRCIVKVPVATANGAGRDETRWARSGWARLFGDRGLHQPDNFLRRGPNYDYTFAGIQAGLDLYAREQADGTMDKAGIYIGYGQISSNVKGQFGAKAGSVDMDAYTLGGYWTHFAPAGWYTDAVVQGTWYTNTAARSVLGETVKPDGFGILASLEAGYAFKFGPGWSLEPQAQIVYQNVSFDNARDAFGIILFDAGDSLRGRLGLRLTKTWNAADANKPSRLVTAWLRVNAWHEFLGKSKTTFAALDGANPVPFYSYLGGTWGEIGAGVTAQVTDKVNVFATGSYNHSLDNRGRQGWDGRLGATVRW